MSMLPELRVVTDDECKNQEIELESFQQKTIECEDSYCGEQMIFSASFNLIQETLARVYAKQTILKILTKTKWK